MCLYYLAVLSGAATNIFHHLKKKKKKRFRSLLIWVKHFVDSFVGCVLIASDNTHGD